MDLITPAAGLLFWMTLIFAVVFFILAKFGFPAITGMVKKRQEHITGALRDAQTAKESLASLKVSCDKMLDDTRIEQEKLLASARSEAKAIVEQARVQARKESEEAIARTSRDMEALKEGAIKDLQSVVADVAVALAEKILREKLSDEKVQIDLVERIIDEQRNNS